MSRQRLDAAIRYFFEEYLSSTQRTRLMGQSSLVDVRLGEYKKDDTGNVTVAGGGTRNPDYRIEIGAQSLPMTGGIPTPAGQTYSASGRFVHLLWLREAADIVTDTEQEITRVMANLNHYVESSAASNAAAWARAIASHPNRASLTQNIHAYTAVPTEFAAVAPNLMAFKQVLTHFFTFDDAGAHYARWRGATRNAPDDYTLEYRDHNVLELQLERDEAYIYGVVPTRFLDASAPESGSRFREVVWGFRWGGADGDTPIAVRVVYTVACNRPEAGDYWDFCCLWADEGVGVAMAVTARSAISADLADFLLHLPEAVSDRAAYLARSPLTTNGDTPLLRLLADVDASTSLPSGVEALSRGGVTALYAPVDRIDSLASLRGVNALQTPRPVYPRSNEARTMVHHGSFHGRVASEKEGGQGAIVGIIDTGIDGNHPSFGDRIVGVWDQNDPTGPTPAARMNFWRFFDPAGNFFRRLLFGVGTEFSTATAIRERARDSDSHGTHVAGIAAGQEVTGANPVPAGMAPRSRIIMVENGRPVTPGSSPAPVAQTLGDAMDFDIVTAVAYIIERANEIDEDAPIAINMSFGHHDHAHDGTDVLSRSMNGIAKRNNEYVPGLALVAAAGNERGDDFHAQATIAANGSHTFGFQITSPPPRSALECIQTIWVTNPRAAGAVLAATVQVRSRDTPTAVTAVRGQSLTHTPHWTHFDGLGVHVGISFGPKDTHNNDFQIRVVIRTAEGFVPDPAGTIVISGTNFRRVILEPDWTIRNSTPPQSLFDVPNSRISFVAQSPNWDVVLQSTETEALTVHAWSARENSTFSTPADSHLICSPACAESVISVAACNSRQLQLSFAQPAPNPPIVITSDSRPEGALSSFSSPGPLRPPGVGPGIDITAPGSRLLSARSANATNPPGNALHNANAVSLQGTSMASPVVTGLIAALLADEPTLTTPQIRQRLARCAIPTTLKDGTTAMSGPATVNDWGSGLIDVNQLKPAPTP